MPVALTPAIVLSSLRYSESSKIVRLATRDLGVQSAIAKGARRPKSRFGASLQVLSEGQAQLYLKERRELHTLAAFDLIRVPVGIAGDLERYAVASSLAEVMVRFAPADPHPESFDLLRDALGVLDAAPAADVQAAGLRAVWQLVSALGFAPSLDDCVHCGAAAEPTGEVAFSPGDGGVVCSRCAGPGAPVRLPERARRDLAALLAPAGQLPLLDFPHFVAHQRLLGRYVRYHLGEGAELPALDFWTRRPWTAR
jgi:DNA repair protein RecO (recombination protein O)